jgi:hypothetical protein
MRGLALPILVASALTAADARADSKATTAESLRDDPHVIDGGPNRLLLATGLATLGFAYGISAYVGATTERGSERWLLVPVSGPWLALARREGCAEVGATPCDVEPTFQGLLVADGLIQLAGVAQLALAFVKRERRETQAAVARTVSLLPARMPGGAGLFAHGAF